MLDGIFAVLAILVIVSTIIDFNYSQLISRVRYLPIRRIIIQCIPVRRRVRFAIFSRYQFLTSASVIKNSTLISEKRGELIQLREGVLVRYPNDSSFSRILAVNAEYKLDKKSIRIDKPKRNSHGRQAGMISLEYFRTATSPFTEFLRGINEIPIEYRGNNWKQDFYEAKHVIHVIASYEILPSQEVTLSRLYALPTLVNSQHFDENSIVYANSISQLT